MSEVKKQGALEEEVARLRAENASLTREMAVMQGVIDRSRAAAIAKSRLGEYVSAEKSRLEKYMHLLLENCPDVILLFDQSGRFLYCTDVFLKATGIHSFGQVNGRTYQEVFARFATLESIARFEEAYHESMRKREPVQLEEMADMALDGHPRNLSIFIAPLLDEQGGGEGALALFHDVTENVLSREKAERESEAKSSFITTVSHAIRTPMNAILGLTDMLYGTPMTREQRGYLDNIHGSAHALMNLINDVLAFSKIEMGKLFLEEDFFSLPVLLAAVRERFAILFIEKGIAFHCDFSDAMPEVVFGDERRIRQVLVSLLDNALKNTKEGSVIFSAYRDTAGLFCFDVSDTGAGVREEDIPYLFTPFQQTDRARSKMVTGDALALALTSRLCALMDGSVTVRSEYGMGSAFSIRLPLVTGEAGDMLPAESAPAVAFTAPEARVLLVDDIEINLLIADAMLATFGIHATQAMSGEEALACLAKEPYDMVFMDHVMPGMDGVEATQSLRVEPGLNQAVPVIALTANAISGAREMFLSCGFNDFLSKPIDRNAMAACLYRWLPEEKVLLPE